ncbi:MAG: hypothetical protein HC896_09745 [Bacteroidales bacterium]|nr:hypothetical protein [Bacteroidales bacterium]
MKNVPFVRINHAKDVLLSSFGQQLDNASQLVDVTDAESKNIRLAGYNFKEKMELKPVVGLTVASLSEATSFNRIEWSKPIKKRWQPLLLSGI